MPFDDLTQEDFAQKMIDECKAAGVSPKDVWPQSCCIVPPPGFICTE
jgi:glycerophosphoryl diester phosphodiesterase